MKISVWVSMVITSICVEIICSIVISNQAFTNDDISVGAKAGEVRVFVPTSMMKFCWCPAGRFRMGYPVGDSGLAAKDPVDVTLSKGFWIARTETTQREWSDVMKTAPWTKKSSQFLFPGVKVGDDFPAVFIEHGMDMKGDIKPDTASDFCRKLSERERLAGHLPNGWRYDLPTEAQWEYACRAGTSTRFSCGNDELQLTAYAWFGALSKGGSAAKEEYAHEVGTMKSNAWKICDMHGNVTEWCRDIYCIGKLTGGTDPLILSDESANHRSLRGGPFMASALVQEASMRGGVEPTHSACTLGFRIVLIQD